MLARALFVIAAFYCVQAFSEIHYRGDYIVFDVKQNFIQVELNNSIEIVLLNQLTQDPPLYKIEVNKADNNCTLILISKQNQLRYNMSLNAHEEEVNVPIKNILISWGDSDGCIVIEHTDDKQKVEPFSEWKDGRPSNRKITHLGVRPRFMDSTEIMVEQWAVKEVEVKYINELSDASSHCSAPRLSKSSEKLTAETHSAIVNKPMLG